MNSKLLLTLTLLLLSALPHLSHASSAGVSPDSLNKGLVGHWTFDGKNMISNVKDSSGQNNNGALVGFGATSTAVVPGKIGQGLKFDGSNDYVQLPDIFPTAVSMDFTISGWVYMNNLTTQQYIFSDEAHLTVGQKGYVIMYYNPGDSKFYIMLRDAVSLASASIQNNTIITAGRWYHVVATFNSVSNQLYLYVNNKVSSTGNASSIDSLSNNLNARLGSQGNGVAKLFKNTLDDVRIYNRALSASEVKELYNLGSAKINESVPSIETGLVGHWTFDGKNMISNVKDTSGKNNHGALVGFGATSTAVVPGKIGQALKFDGVNDRISVPLSSSLTDLKKTVSFWMKSTSLASGPIGFSFADSTYFRFFSGQFTITYTDSTLSIRTVTGLKQISNNIWQHFTVTYDSDGTNNLIKVYKDGQFLVATSSAMGFTASAFTSIGARTNSSLYFPGYLDDVRYYNRALSATEIKQLYNLGSAKINESVPSIETGLVGHWTFDGKNMISNVKDSSGKNNHGALVGFGATSTAVVPGKIGQGLKFDGSNDYVNAGSASSLDNAFSNGMPATYSAWIYPTKANATSYIISKTSSGDMALYLDTTLSPTSLRFYVSTSLSPINVYSTTAISLNRWTHVAVTWDGVVGAGGSRNFYINGVLTGKVAANNGSGTIGNFNAYNMTMGSRSGGTAGSFFPGSLDDVRIYSRALSASEVKQLYNMGR